MSRRLGQLIKFILVGVALAACGGSSGSSSLSGPVATELQTSINGWSFPNYPASEFPDTDFNETDLVSMFGSGSEICVGGVATPCKLTAEASAWARMVNQSRASGACEGLVAIASTRFNKKEQPSTVKIPAQDEALHAIMRAFATQFLPEVQEAITMWLNKSLDEKIAELTKSFTAGTLDYTLGLYTEGGGHALLPYAIEYPTPTTPKILLYDSNWPGKNRYIDVDLKAKTWRFSFSGEDPATDPDAWTGGPQDMDLTPLTAREGTCPFCGDGTKVEKTTMLIRSSNLDWSVETDGGVVSPANPVGTDGTSVLPVKGFLKRDSYDYFVSVPTAPDSKSATTVAKKKTKKNKSKLKFSGSTSVYAMMPDGIAQFTTPGTSNNPVEIEGSSISTKDPGVDLTLASGNLVANASGAAISLSISGGTMEVAVTTASGQVVQQQVSEDKPTLQMKADSTGGGITVLAASSTGVVEKTEVSSTGVETKTVVKEVLNLSAVKAELPPELASKEIAALPSIATRNMANPNYKIDPVYTAPTTTVPKESSGGVSSKGVPQAPTVGRLILPSVEFGEAPFTVQAPTSNSKGEWKFSSSKSEIAQINATTGRITITGAGTTTITATQAAVKDYESISVTADLIVVRATPVLGAFTTASRAVGEEAFALASPTSTSSAAFKLESSDESVAKFSKVNGKLLLVGAGKTTITATQPANDDYLAASKNFVLTVRKGTPVLTATADVSSTFGEIGPAISKPTSDSRGAITFTSSNPAVATINATTGQTSIVNAGTSTVTITQAATDDYVSASQTMTFTVKPALPALGALSVGSKTFGDAGFSIAKPTSLSSGSFTFTSSNSRVIKISEAGVATIEGAGTATITASQAAAGNYAANSVTAEITVAKGAPELSNISLTGLVFGAADVTMQPQSTSAGAFSFFSNNARVLTVNETSGRVSVVGAGTATVTVKQASTTNYESASKSVTVQVGLATPAFERLSPISKDFGDSSFIFNWGTSPSNGLITYESTDPTKATIDTTGRVTIVNVGTTTLKMKQGVGSNHNATEVVAVLTIGRGTPVYGDFVIANKTYGAAPFLLTRPTTTSSGAFTFATRLNGTLNDTSVATVDSTGRITIIAPGSIEIIASQLATDTHTASTISTTFVVSAATPTFGSFVAPSKTFGDVAFTMSAPSSQSSGAFTFSSSNTNVATITSTGAVEIIGAGSTTITASQAAATPYTARSITAAFTVAKATPALSSFGGEISGLAGKRYVGYFADAPNWFATATLHGDTVTSTQIQNFTSSNNYYSWEWLGTFRSTTAGTYNFCTASDDASYLWVGTTATSGFTTTNAVVKNPGTHPVVTQCGNVTLAAASNYPIRIQFGENTGQDAMSVYFTPPGGTATYNGTGYFLSGGGITKIVGDQPFTPTIPSSVSAGAITYSSSNPAVAAIDPTSGLITVISGGSTTITAEQAATSNYNSSTVTTTLTVLRDPMLSAMSAITKTYGVEPFTLTAPTSNSNGAITYASSDTSVATVNATTGLVTLNGAGTTTITASQIATATYTSASVSTTLTVEATTFTSLSAGAYHTCARTSTGAAQCFGYNTYGQLGDGTTTDRLAPVTVTGLSSGVRSVSSGVYHSCALMDSGAVKCWGYGPWGNLGQGTTDSSYTPVDVVGINDLAMQLVTTQYSTCVRTGAGGVKCWGYNGWGQLGDGTNNNSYSPVNVSGMSSGIVSIAAGGQHMCAIRNTGALSCWGYNGYGQLGDGSGSDRTEPSDVFGLDFGVTAVAPGMYHTCATLATGAVKCWGLNDNGQLGDNSWNSSYNPVSVYGITDATTSISSGERHTCVIKTSGALWCWGDSYNGLGDGTADRSNTPINISSLGTGVRKVSAGLFGRHTCVLTTTGNAKCWGRNSEGELGDGTTTQRLSPTNIVGVVSPQLGVTTLGPLSLPGSGYTATSPSFTIAPPTSNRSGTFRFASSNPNSATIDAMTGEVNIVGNGATLFSATQDATSTHDIATAYVSLNFAPMVTQLSMGYYHSCGLTNTGAMKCWGYNGYGQIGTLASWLQTTPSNLPGYTNNVSAIAAGDFHTCALTTVGAVKCFGYNAYGETYGGITSGAVAISAGYFKTCALMSYGGVKCWGYNGNGQLGDGTNTYRYSAADVVGLTSGVTAITSGREFTCALLNTGAVKCWGYNGFGQLGDGTNTSSSVPTQVSGITSGAVAIAAGENYACALLATGAVKCWGYNGYGQLGDGTYNWSNQPVSVISLGNNVRSITAGGLHSCAVTTSGAAKCWGYNNEGSLGDGTSTTRPEPVDVVGLSSGVLSIEASETYTTCATVSGNNVKCWGWNPYGNVGDGSTTNRYSPVDVTGLLSGSVSDTTLGALTLPNSRYTTSSADFTLTAPTSDRAGTFSFASSNPEVVTVNAETGVVHIEGIGTAVLGASLGGNGQYRATSAQVTINVGFSCANGGPCDIGDTGPGGGVVFYDAGSNQSWGRYLEFAPSSAEVSRAWSTGSNQQSSVPGTDGTAIGTGLHNTTLIAAQSGNLAASSAAAYAANYSNNNKNDWFVPSKDELNELCKYARNTEQAAGSSTICSGGSTPAWRGFTADWHWSSSQYSRNGALDQNFYNGDQGGDGKDWIGIVRPVRAFAPLSDCQLAISCAVGDIGPAGGRIIYVNPTQSNEYDFVEAAPTDIAPNVWCAGPKANSVIGSESWYREPENALVLSTVQLRNCSSGAGTAAQDYSVNGFSGWQIPNYSLVELMRTALYDNGLGSLFSSDYLTANESDANNYLTVDMTNGAMKYTDKSTATRLRAVRFFAKADRSKKTPTLSLSVPSNNYAYGAADFYANSWSSGINDFGSSLASRGTITYTSSDTSVATVEPYTGLVSIVGSGYFTITATQDAWGIFKAPTSISTNIYVANGTPQFSGFAIPSTRYRADDGWFDTTNATSPNSSGAITYTSSNTAVATINATTGRVTIVAAGTTSLTATLAQNGFWDGATLSVPLAIGALCADGGECRIGDVGPGGGRIFLLPTSTGNTTNKYFEAASSDLPSAMAWCNDTSTSVTGANGYVLGTGEANTTAIDAACTSGAAQGAADYTNNGIGDWYLPSKDELNQMYNARTIIGGLASGYDAAYYWSSSEYDAANAWLQGFDAGLQYSPPKSDGNYVRPIRSFEIRRSCLDIKNATGTNTNGMYTIALNVNGAIINTQVYCLMDSAMSGGGWTLTMKAPSYSTAFGFNANYWTTANTLNEGNASNVTSDPTNAKFNSFNYLSGTEMLAIFPDAGINGGSVTGHTYGWTWKQTIPNGPKTPLAIFSGPMEQFIGDADNFSGFDTRIFSRQKDIRFYGFNWYDNHQSRWGFGWNENGGGLWPNGYKGSDDVSGGIGLGYNSYSAGDMHFGWSTSVGLSRPMSFETYVR